MPAQQCWRSAGSGGRPAACARHSVAGGSTLHCTLLSTAAAQAMSALQESGGTSHVSWQVLLMNWDALVLFSTRLHSRTTVFVV